MRVDWTGVGEGVTIPRLLGIGGVSIQREVLVRLVVDIGQQNMQGKVMGRNVGQL